MIDNFRYKRNIFKHIVYAAVFFAFAQTNVFAQMSGVFTIGFPSSPYATINDAVADLYAQGVYGPVTFKLYPKTYNEQIEFNGPIPFASAVNTITFKSDQGNPADVNVAYTATSAADNFIWKINNAQHIIIRDMTISAGGTDYSTAILLENAQGELSFINNVVNGYASAATGNSQSLIVCDNAGNLDNVSFADNEFNGGFTALYLYPNSSSSGLSVSNNVFFSQNKRGVSIRNFNSPAIESNSFDNVAGYAVYLFECVDSFSVKKNSISNSSNSQNFGIQISSCAGTSSANGIVVNNFIQSLNTGIKIDFSSYVNVYFNSVNIEDALSGSLATTKALYLVSDNSNIKVANNILANKRDGYAYHAGNLSGSQISFSDYNNLYTTGSFAGAWDNIDKASLSDFAAASGTDANSQNADPQFYSLTDLHAASSRLDNEGIPLSIVADDYDGDTRDASTPSVGADEYQYFQGVFTIGTGGDYPNISSAVADLLKGITGAVTFNILNGTYIDRIVLSGPIAGNDATNAITFQSNSGNASDVSIVFSATSSLNNNLIKVDSVDYVTFQNLTFSAQGSAYSRIALLENSPENLTFSNNIFNGNSSSPSTADQDLFFCNSGSLNFLSFDANTFNDGRAGLNLSPNIPSSGITVFNNTFSSQTDVGVSLYNFVAPEIISNAITDSDGGAINLQACSGAALIEKNNIVNSNTNSSTGINISGFLGSASGKLLISNNFIQSTYRGIYLSSSSYVNVYFNSVNIYSADLSNLVGSTALYILYGNSALNIADNVLANNRGGYAYNVFNNGSAQISNSNYNDLYSTGTYVGSWEGTATQTLSDFQTASGNETNSKSADPQFASMTDLHANSLLIEAAGFPIGGVAEDFDGDARSLTNPSVGADEFVTSALGGTYFVGSGGDYPTISAAIDDMYLKGIKTAVTFRILDGVYNAQINLDGAVYGSDSLNAITITSDLEDPSSVKLRYSAASSAENYVLRINGVGYVTIKNLTLSAKGTDYAKAVSIENPDGNLTFSNNVFNGYSAASLLDEQDLVYSVSAGNLSNAVFLNNVFNYGYIGLHLNPFNSSSGLRIEGNSFSGQINSSISIASFSSPTVASNSFAYFQLYALHINNCSDSLLIEKNAFSSGAKAIWLQNNAASASSRSMIVNNFVHVSNWGIFIESSDYVNVYFNSVNVSDSTEIQHGINAIRLINNSNLNIGDNIFSTSENGYLYYVGAPSSSQINVGNYNSFYSTYPNSYIASWEGSAYSTLSAFQTASGHEGFSVYADPLFVSETDLHASSTALANAGVPFAAVTDDYDGETRDSAAPSIGADEFASVLKLNVKIFLEAPYSSGVMNTLLNAGGLLPSNQPYDAAPWNYAGGESVSAFPVNAVDWILLELRDKNNSSAVVSTRAALLLSDGTIVDTSGSGAVGFEYAEDDYFIAIKHRNHLGVMSAAAIRLSGAQTNYDFTTGSAQFFGGSAGALEIESGVWGMWNGDSNNDNSVTNADKSIINSTGIYEGYHTADLNFDGSVTNADKSVVNINKANTPASQIP
ncbi:MAG: right-handed parallel beta-helix repeat-containing protein [Chlorobi bacterium]|nr:right-handed parallel beta-helix repeat-containing protein [Chlorobiota bacterium]